MTNQVNEAHAEADRIVAAICSGEINGAAVILAAEMVLAEACIGPDRTSTYAQIADKIEHIEGRLRLRAEASIAENGFCREGRLDA
ncbi:hypothetical protein OEZ60_20535 [Defluviimonas sp. WL0024]|uniref:Uncharacterized protein n=1 Tax=Albidovulum salinarum TaxID=2984153 RepID=A0ABT2X8U4_9RHOB|nr:hypothetical protein [Defluviimonas sp. WL0024]MCU9850376.1 hypothetical protein [Defluviimonas sp. WL0024]